MRTIPESKKVLKEYGFIQVEIVWCAADICYLTIKGRGIFTVLFDEDGSRSEFPSKRAALDAAATWCKKNLKARGK